jgi:hypothetical protein
MRGVEVISRHGGKRSGALVQELALPVKAASTSAPSHESAGRPGIPKNGLAVHRSMASTMDAGEVVKVGNTIRVAAIPLVGGRGDG